PGLRCNRLPSKRLAKGSTPSSKWRQAAVQISRTSLRIGRLDTDSDIAPVQTKGKKLIDDTLQKFDREIIVTFLNDVKHLIKRNSRSQQVFLKIEDADFVRTTEQEVRNLFPVCGLKS